MSSSSCSPEHEPEPAPDPHTQTGVLLSGPSRQYRVERILHRGRFSTVVACRLLETEEVVAVKVFRENKSKAGRREAEVLDQVRQLRPDTNNLLKFTEMLVHRNRCCLVFDLLETSLFDFMERRDFEPLDIWEIRPVAQQILVALRALRSMNLVHADITPKSILLVDHQTWPFKVKLASFDHATEASALREQNLVQNYAYRPPEVVLDHPSLDAAVDMWSLGCVLAFLYLGEDLYPFDCEYEALRMMQQLNRRHPSQSVLDSARRTRRFFHSLRLVDGYRWWLKTPEHYTLDTGNTVMDHCGYSKDFFSVKCVVMSKIDQSNPALQEEGWAFTSLLEQMLEVDLASRITPDGALGHTFITMRHLPLRSKHPVVIKALEAMRAALGRDPAGVL